MNFEYTISCIFLSNFLSIEIKEIGFQKLFLDHVENIGFIYFNKSIDQKKLKILEIQTGIKFWDMINDYTIKFSFFIADSFYYNYKEIIIENNDDPFRVKSFSFTVDENNHESSIMLERPRFIHITGKDDELFIYSNQNKCDYCHKQTRCLHFNHTCHFCISCLLILDTKFN